eukprot:g7344.t1
MKNPIVPMGPPRESKVRENRRPITILGILFLVAILLSLIQLLPSAQVLYSKYTAPRTKYKHDSNSQVFYLDDTCIDCEDDEQTVSMDFKEFPDLELERQMCLLGIRNRMIEDYRPFFENVSDIALIDVALHYNLGDSILWRASIHLASLFGHSVDYVCAKSQAMWDYLDTFPRCDMHKLIRLTKRDGLIMYAAGGNWGNLYKFIQDYRLSVFRTLGKYYRLTNATYKVIQLPQSIAYTSNISDAITRDDAIINSLPDGMFTLFTRQDDSFVWAQNHYSENIDIKVSPDMAFALGQLSPIGTPSIDVVLIMRGDTEDKEKRRNLRRAVARKFNGTGLTYSFQGYNYHDQSTEYVYEHPTLLSEVRLNSAIRTISKGRLLITNRFHGHVVGMLMGKTTFWIDTVQKKLRHSRVVAFSSSKHCTDRSMRSFEFSSTLRAVDAAIDHLSLSRSKSSKSH